MALPANVMNDPAGPVVEVRKLHKHDGQTLALDAISFSAQAGRRDA